MGWWDVLGDPVAGMEPGEGFVVINTEDPDEPGTGAERAEGTEHPGPTPGRRSKSPDVPSQNRDIFE